MSLPSLQPWVARFLPAEASLNEELLLLPLNGDAGFRQYFRTNTCPSLIAVFAPPVQEDNPSFVSKALVMRAHGLHVPKIFAVDFQQGFMLLEDLGDALLLPQLNDNTMAELYTTAEQALMQLQSMPADTTVFPLYDRQKLDDEMALFPEWFVSRLLTISLGEDDRQMLRQTFHLLLDSATEQPQVVVHRDYHSRNLLTQPGGSISMVDFQDAVVGPVTYDLVSLLRDCYIRWPAELVRERALQYARQCGLLEQVSEQQFLRWFDWMGLQRHIKVLGIFSRLWLRDEKPSYLDDLPLVIRYTLEQAKPYPELAAFVDWFENTVLRELESGKYHWYQPWQAAGEN